MSLIQATLIEPEPTENVAPNWGEVLRLARKQYEALRQIDAEVRSQVEAAKKVGVCPDEMLADVHQPDEPVWEMYKAVMTAFYGPKFWPWHDERMMDIIT